LVSALALASPSANALPADGSNCSANWVNNQGAMACFIQGQQDIKNGVAHPHYVACTKAGEVFCCVDNDSGSQNCEAQARTGRATLAQQLAGVLNAQLSIMTSLRALSGKVDRLEGKIEDLNRKPSQQ
jgi:hypothetical protein